MVSSLSAEIKKTFELATLRKEAAKIFTPEEWKELQKIKEKFDGQKRYEKRVYDLEYKTRVEVARKRLINKAGEKQKIFNPVWVRNDRFEKDAINRQAVRNVQSQFKKIIQHYESLEARAIRGLLSRCDYARQVREKPRKDFAKAVDRRNGAERRQTRMPKLSR